MNYLYPINLINRQGRVILAYSVDDVLDFVEQNGWFQKYWVTESSFFGADSYWDRHPSSPWLRRGETYSNEWIARDDRGRIVDPKHFTPRPRAIAYWSKRSQRRQKEIAHAVALGLPIPGVHRYSRHRCYARKSNGGRGVRVRNAALKDYDEKCLKMQTNEFER